MIDPIKYLMTIIYSIHYLLKWTIFCVFHLIIFSTLALVLWLCQIQPQQVTAKMISLSQALHLSNVFALMSFLGISGGAFLFAYIKIWNKIYTKLSTPFIFKGANELIKATDAQENRDE
jgi:hypothetical protein